MKRKKEMLLHEPFHASAPITFHDVAAYFSEEEWRLLHERQKELYKNVMMEIHRALISLGFQIVNPNTLLRVHKRENVNTQDEEKTLEIGDSLTALYPAVKPDILLRIKPNEEINSSIQRHLSESEIKDCPDTEDVVIKSVVSFIIKEEGGTSSMDEEFPKKSENISRTAGVHFPNSENLLRTEREYETTLLDHDVRSISESSPDPSSEHVITKSAISPIFKNETQETIFSEHNGSEQRECISNRAGCGIKSRRHKKGHCTNVCSTTTLKALSPRIITEMPEGFENEEHAAIQQWPACCGIKSRRHKKGHCTNVCSTTTLKALSPGIITEMPEGFENEEHAAIQQWPACKYQPEGERSIRFESSFGLPVPSNLSTQANDISQSERYRERSSHQRNAKLHQCSPNLLGSWRSDTFAHCDTDNTAVQTDEIPPHNAKFDKVVPQISNDEKTVHNLNRREKRNPAQRSFICDVCEKTFRHKDSLTKHQRIHTGERPYQCSDCERCFSRKESLIIHIRTHTGERPFTCTECDLTFINKGNLITHGRTHTGDKPYQCSECKKRFSVKIGLIRHERTHTGEKPYTCTECEKSFTQKQNLIKHQRTHSGEKPYQCYDCEKCFSEKISLYRHQRLHIGQTNTA